MCKRTLSIPSFTRTLPLRISLLPSFPYLTLLPISRRPLNLHARSAIWHLGDSRPWLPSSSLMPLTPIAFCGHRARSKSESAWPTSERYFIFGELRVGGIEGTTRQVSGSVHLPTYLHFDSSTPPSPSLPYIRLLVPVEYSPQSRIVRYLATNTVRPPLANRILPPSLLPSLRGGPCRTLMRSYTHFFRCARFLSRRAPSPGVDGWNRWMVDGGL